MGKQWGRGGYRPGYSEAHSPMWATGRADAERDKQLIANGEDPIGPLPPKPEYPVMYMRGYNSVIEGGGET